VFQLTADGFDALYYVGQDGRGGFFVREWHEGAGAERKR